ncbi:MAG: ATP-binding protein [Bacillaceae bacterium]
MNKLSYKLGGLLFMIIFLLQGILSILLYSVVVNNRVEEEVEQLLIRGTAYSNLLSTNPQEETLSWITSLEKQQDTKIVVSDGINLQVLGKMDTVSQEMLNQIREGKDIITSKSMVMESDWTNKDYLCTISPIFNQKQVVGYVYLFEDTSYIRSLVDKISMSFLVMTCLSLLVTGVAVYYLTTRLTKPILKIKEKTKALMREDTLQVESLHKRDELGELEELIEKLGKELNELKDQRNDFLASISHELRTPLTYIQGYINVLYKHTLNTEQKNHYLKIVKEESEALTNLIENLFLLARLDKNEFMIEKTKTHMPTLINKIVEKIKIAHETSGKQITLHDETVNGWIMIDPIRMEQVFINIVNNAIRYTDKNGEIIIILKEDDTSIFLIIKDNGKGISKEEQEKIFQPFYRVEKGRNRMFGGYGLGLSIVKEIIEKHGGKIIFQSAEGKGTTFKIILSKEI